MIIFKTAPRLAAALVFLNLLLVAGARAQEDWRAFNAGGVTINYTAADETEKTKLAGFISNGRQTVQKFFGRDFDKKFVVFVYPDRKALTTAWRTDWKVPDLETECWMVASGTAEKFSLLAPRTWKTEACEHDPADTADTQLVVTHELVHVYHGQHSPHPDFDGMDDVAWFVEGLAVYASGQLESQKMATARDAIENGKAPATLEKAWSGKYRYGVSGSIVKYVDARFGRKTILKMLGATTEKELLDILKLTEAELLDGWKKYVLENRL
ncbi:MAG: hypothetical protein JSS81_15560 [Acidobacteria bacterium]|nr:hypothetical protein [Acidobacteriota bacterium]